MFIYLIVNRETGKYYVGQHRGNNLKHYLQQKLYESKHRRDSRSYLYASMRVHSDPSAWSIHALRSDIQDRQELDQTEKDFIAFLKATDPEYGYNICRGGEGFTGPHTEDARRKMSDALRVRWSNPQARIEQSKAAKRSWSEERRVRMSKVSGSRWSDPEFKGKMVRTQKKAWSSIEARARMTVIGRQVWSDAKRLSERGQAIRRALSNPQEQARRAEATRKCWLDPDYRARMAEMARRLWSSPDYRAKVLRARNKPEGENLSDCG